MKYIALALSSVLLFGCGGGGGGGAPAASAKVVSTETFLLKQAYANYFNNTKTETSTITGTVNVTDNGTTQSGTVSGNGTSTSSAITGTTFEGMPALQKTRTASGSITIVAGGQSATQALPNTSLTHYATTDFLPLGSVASTGGYTAVSAPASIPVTAKVNDSGTIASYVTYASSAKGAPANTSVLSYQLAADTASTAILNLTETVKTTGGVVISTTTWSHRMTPAGALTHLNDLATTTLTSGTSTLWMELTLTY